MNQRTIIFDETIHPYSVLAMCRQRSLFKKISIGSERFSEGMLEKIAKAMADFPDDALLRSIFEPRVRLRPENETTGCSLVDTKLCEDRRAHDPYGGVSVRAVEFTATTASQTTCVGLDGEALLIVTNALLRVQQVTYPLKHFTMTSRGHFSLQGSPPLRTLPHLGQ